MTSVWMMADGGQGTDGDKWLEPALITLTMLLSQADRLQQSLNQMQVFIHSLCGPDKIKLYPA